MVKVIEFEILERFVILKTRIFDEHKYPFADLMFMNRSTILKLKLDQHAWLVELESAGGDQILKQNISIAKF